MAAKVASITPFLPIADYFRESIALEFYMWTRRLLLCLMLMLATLSALAAPRNFPANVQRGVMSASVYPQIMINGQAQLLAPGAKIFDDKNLIIMATSLLNNAYTVNYTIDAQGKIDRIWVLTNEELAQSQ
jgi:hypothetical protein